MATETSPVLRSKPNRDPGNSFNRGTQGSFGWTESCCISHDMLDYDLVTNNLKINVLSNYNFLSLHTYHRSPGVLMFWDTADRACPIWAFLGTSAKGWSMLPPKKWDMSLPLIFHWPMQVTWPHLTSKGQVQVCETLPCLQTRITGEPHYNNHIWIRIFWDSVQGHFQNPFLMHRHLYEDEERKCMCHPIFFCSNMLYFFCQGFLCCCL